jgi:hypothetical protein
VSGNLLVCYETISFQEVLFHGIGEVEVKLLLGLMKMIGEVK